MIRLPQWLSSKEPACQCRKHGFDPWVGRIPWRRAWHPTPVFLPRESPWTEEPGRLQSMVSQRAGHDWATKQQQQPVITGKKTRQSACQSRQNEQLMFCHQTSTWKNILWVSVLVSYCCCNRLPQIYWLKTAHVYRCVILDFRMWHRSHWAEAKAPAGLRSSWRVWRGSHFLTPSVHLQWCRQAASRQAVQYICMCVCVYIHDMYSQPPAKHSTLWTPC